MLNKSTVYKITERMLELNNSCTILIRICFSLPALCIILPEMCLLLAVICNPFYKIN